MTRRDGFWMAAGAIFALVNAGGGGYAVAVGESMHAAIHGALPMVGIGVAWWMASKNARRDVPILTPADDRLERLQQSMDAIALEVERIGEAERFRAKLESSKAESRQ